MGAFRAETPIPATSQTRRRQALRRLLRQDEAREIVAYAADRGITVMPEIELPGHARAALTAYPELGCVGEGYQLRTTWGIDPDIYCAGEDRVFSFLADVFEETLDIFPSEFIHIGGDEAPKQRWAACPKCQARIKAEGLADEDELQSWFIRQIESWLNERGRRLIGWDEILEGGLAPNATVMSWRGSDGGIAAANAGHDVVMTPNTYCYLDYYQHEDWTREPPAIASTLTLEQTWQFAVIPQAIAKRTKRGTSWAGRAISGPNTSPTKNRWNTWPSRAPSPLRTSSGIIHRSAVTTRLCSACMRTCLALIFWASIIARWTTS